MKISRRLKAVLTATAGVVTVSMLLTSCSSADSAPVTKADGQLDLSSVTLRFGQPSNLTAAAIVASGVLDDAEYKVDFASFQNSGDISSSLITGQLDFVQGFTQWSVGQAAAGATPAWSESSAGFKAVGVIEPGNTKDFDPFMILSGKDSGIKSVADTKGARWGYVPGSVLQLVTAKAVTKQGWTFPDDITPVTLDYTSQALALGSDLADLQTTYINSAGAALAGGANKIGTAASIGIDLFMTYTASTRALKDPAKEAAISDLLERLAKFQAWFASHPAEAQAALVEGLRLSPEQAKLSWEYDRGILRPVTTDAIANTQGVIADAYGFGLLKNSIDANLLFDDRFTAQIEQATTAADAEAIVSGSF